MRRVFKSEYFRANHLVGQAKGEIGGYRVLGVLGEGAGSTVYEVQDPADGQLYAMKVVNRDQPSDQRFVDQALNEHEVGSRFDHPFLRKSLRVIRQGGLIGAGPSQTMLLLELVDGVTLETRRPRGRRPMVEVFKGVASGLGAMHAVGIVHADMKPINILLINSGGLKIIDFGQSCPVNTVKTRIQGTLDYIAPEQVRRGPITARTDVYNLGATMYWCVTDRHPPTALRLRGTPGQPMPETDHVLRDPREYNPHLPPALSGLILDCLQQEPADRPASMTDVIFRLDMALHQLQQEGPARGPVFTNGGVRAPEAPELTSRELLAQIMAEAAKNKAVASSARTEDLLVAEILEDYEIEEGPVDAGGDSGGDDAAASVTVPDAGGSMAIAAPVRVPVVDVTGMVVDSEQEIDLPLPVLPSR